MRGNWTHGLSYIPEAVNYKKMLERCYNPKVSSYKYCGAKGVIVEDRWLGKDGLKNFYEDMGPKPSPLHSVDRYPNNKGNYGPSNCRWATMKQQQGNRTNNRIIEHAGVSMIIFDWAKYFGMTYCNLNRQLKKRTFEDIFNEVEARKTMVCKICFIKCPGPTPFCRKHYKTQWARLSKGLISDIHEVPTVNLKKNPSTTA